MKSYYTMNNVGSSKYTVSFHDGVKMHSDGSPFYDIFLTNNKRMLGNKLRDLRKAGYVELDCVPVLKGEK